MANPVKTFFEYIKNQEKRYVLATFLTILIVILVFAGKAIFGDFLKRNTYDILVSTVGGKSKSPDKRVVLLLIDELSMKYGQGIGLGNWPWSRSIYSNILSYINLEGKARAIFFDILFTEFDKGQDSDNIFQQGIRNSDNVFQNVLLIKEKDVKKPEPLPADVAKFFGLDIKNPQDIHWAKFIANEFKLPIPCLRLEAPCILENNKPFIDGTPEANAMIPELSSIAKGLAVASFKKDVDGVHRRGKILYSYGNVFLPSISLAAIKSFYPMSKIDIKDGNVINVGPYQIPLDEEGDYLINFYRKRVEAISMSAVLQSAGYYGTEEKDKILVKPEFFKDKIIIIGCSAVGCEDLKNTPVNPTFPGPELHADIISNILQGNHIISEKNWLTNLIILIFIIICVFAIVLTKSAIIQIGIPIILTVVYGGLSVWLFHSTNYLSPILIIGSTSLFSSGVSFVYLSLTEGAERRKYSKILGNMVDPGIVTEALKDLESLKKGGEKHITAFFSDVAGFSTISEQLTSEGLASLLNEYLSAMTLVLKENGGTLDKYIGDAVVGIFGAPIDLPKNAADAAKASLQMMEEIARLRKYWMENNLYIPDAHNMSFRIGLNTGKAKVGFMGTDNLASYTMMGDTVNLAARLEAAAKDYGVHILISESTRKEIQDMMSTRLLDAVRVKGRSEPVFIYELIGWKGKIDSKIEKASKLYEEGFELYRQKKWDESIQKFQESEEVRGEKDKAVSLLIDRCEVYKKEPPAADWDGVFTRTHK